MKWRGKIIDRAEEPFKIGAIEGLQYNAIDCCLPEHPQRHGKIYTPLEARQLSFGPDCRCDLLPYNSRWGSELPDYSEPIVNKRNRVKKEYESFFNKSDIESLISLEKMYRQDLGWHWAELRDYAEKFIKAGDSEHALTWINSSINERMKQQGCNKTVVQFDSSLASLYSLKGIIYLK